MASLSLKVPQALLRHDFYQTPTSVIVSLFGKGASKEASMVSFTHWEVRGICPPHRAAEQVWQLTYELHLPGSRRSSGIIYLYGPVDPSRCTYKVLSTKVEITLVKADERSWPALEASQEGVQLALPRLTFGVTGRTGTVGGKEMIIAPDTITT